jgi:glycosyltransferase involved in cell wall biosynthesis
VTPLVSIVMPAWQPEPRWLEEAVRSAVAGESCAIEVIVVDDGSPQPVAPMVEAIGDERVRVVRAEHCGPYAARDVGLALASGAYVRFLDADDVSVPGSTSRLLSSLGTAGDRIAYGATEICDEALVPKSIARSDVTGWAAHDCLLGGFDVYHVSMLFPRGVVDAAGRWDQSAVEVSGDWDFVLRALEHAPVQPIDGVVTRYRRHAGSVMSSASIEAGARARSIIIERYFGRHADECGSRLHREAVAALHLNRAAAHAWTGNRRAALGHLWLGARQRPLVGARTAATLLIERLRKGPGDG